MRLLFVCLLVLTSCYAFTQENPDAGLRDFVNSPSGIEGLKSGGAFYVKNSQIELPYEFIYDPMQMIDGVAYTSEGQGTKIQGRYIRPEGSIEVMYLNKKYLLLGETFPRVVLGNKSYLFKSIVERRSTAKKYLQVVSESKSTDYSIVREFKMSIPSHRPPARGIASSSTEAPSMRTDSTDYVYGVRPLLVKLPKNAKKLKQELQSCGVKALELSLEESKFRTLAQQMRFIDLLEEKCAGQ